MPEETCRFCGDSQVGTARFMSREAATVLARDAAVQISAMMLGGVPAGLSSFDVRNDEVDRICPRCRDGWLTSTEGAALMALQPLFSRRKRRPISPARLAPLAAWSARNALMWAAISGADGVIDVAHYSAPLRESGTLDSNWEVWIGLVDRQGFDVSLLAQVEVQGQISPVTALRYVMRVADVFIFATRVEGLAEMRPPGVHPGTQDLQMAAWPDRGFQMWPTREVWQADRLPQMLKMAEL